MNNRIETDSLGPVEVPEPRLWGAQTQRSLLNFAIGGERMPIEVITALAQVKRAAAEQNAARGALDAKLAAAIVAAADEIVSGRWDDEFPLGVWQTGSGTQTNMNLNEVIANLANVRLGGRLGDKSPVHPNDHVNMAQSSNDAFATAMSIAAVVAIEDRLLPQLRALATALSGHAVSWNKIVKMGRTHLMDAVPLTLGQEAGAWAAQIAHGIRAIEGKLGRLRELAIGGTAVGTGLGAPPGWGATMATALTALTGHTFVPAENLFEALACHDAFIEASGALNTLAAALMKIGNDVRWLGSGPRSGLGELILPANEPGSSMMPGKVNPTQIEALTMVAVRVISNHVAITMAGSQGAFQLNTYKPLIIYSFLQSTRLLADATGCFLRLCVAGLRPDEVRLRENVGRSLMLVTALAPVIGYDAAARVAKTAHEGGVTLREAATSLGVISADDFDRLVDPAAMVGPGP